MHIYLAQWVWEEDHWTAPSKSFRIGTLDLRSRSQHKPGPIPEGYAIFAYSQAVTIPGSVFLGQDLTDRISASNRQQVESLLGINISNPAIDKLLLQLFTEDIDPSGQTKRKPVQADKNRKVVVHLAGQKTEKILTEPEFEATTIAVRQADYSRMKGQGVPLDVLRRWNDYDLIQFYNGDDIKLDKLLPVGSKTDGRLPHQTVVSDNFNRANEDISAGSWAEHNSAAYNVTSNAATASTAVIASYARYTSALSSADHKSKVTITSIAASGAPGPAVRCSTDAAPNGDGYWAQLTSTGTTNNIRECVNSTTTDLVDPGDTTVSLPDDLELRISGSTLQYFFNGSQVGGDTTDTTITGNLYCGFHLRRATSDIVDDFTAEDLAAATAVKDIIGMGIIPFAR